MNIFINAQSSGKSAVQNNDKTIRQSHDGDIVSDAELVEIIDATFVSLALIGAVT